MTRYILFLLILIMAAGDVHALNLQHHPLSLSGACVMTINASTGNCSTIQGVTDVNYGGTLTVTNQSGTPAVGNAFTLFAASSYAGAFSSITLPVLPDTLQWNTSSISVNGTISVIQSPWGQWLSQNFTASQLATPAVSGAEAAPNGDGIPNLLKYALGQEPWAGSALPVVQDIESLNGSQYLRLTVAKNPAATDVSYIIEVANALSPANWNAGNTTVEVNTATTLTVRDNIPISAAPAAFIHLKVTQP